MAPEANMNGEFDYVVVGAGTAGCLLTNRLSATGASVCLLEAGGADWSPLIHLPVGYVWNVHSRRLTWNFTTEPGRVVQRSIRLPQGRVLGGSSSINGMSFVRGPREDYDAWAAAGNPGWSYAEVLPYFRRLEQKIGVGDDLYRGREGELRVTDLDWHHPLCDAFLAGMDELGIPRTSDYNGEQYEGAGFFQRTIHGGRRQSSAVSFLRPARRRPQVDVRTRAQASRVLFEGRRAVGVCYVRGGPNGRVETVRARREVILAAGSINSPKLLQISGVGPRPLLETLGVPVVHELPGVGQNLQDHYRVRLVSKLRYVRTINELVKFPGVIAQGWRWLRGKPSVLGLSASMAHVFARSSAEAVRPDMEYVFAPASFRGGIVGLIDGWPGMTIGAWQSRPLSTGHVHAISDDPFEAPCIQPNYLNDERDQRVLINGIRLGRRMLETSYLRPFLDSEQVPGPDCRSDDEVLDFARRTGETVYHVVGSCRMGPADRPDSVVDASLRVHGLEGLRVVDASIMPSLPSVNTNAPSFMIAEKGADLILGTSPLPPAPVS